MTLPIPALDDHNKEFWTGGFAGELRIVQCDDCEKFIHPPTPRCGYCYSNNVAPKPVSGRGHIYTFTINRQSWQPDLKVPYVIAIVELEEQSDLRLMTNIVDTDVDDVAINQQVEVAFEDRGAVSVPVFRLVGA